MKEKAFLLAFSLLFAFSNLRAQPNLLFIAVDDLKPMLNA